MSKRGRKPVPTSIPKLRGSWRANTRGQEPRLTTERPRRPKWLIGRARTEWELLVPELLRAGLLTKIDRMELALLCQRYADYLKARGIVTEEGPLIETTNGNWIQHPALGIMNKAWSDVINLGANFGLSPADRASIGLSAAPQESNPKCKFFDLKKEGSR